MFRSQVGGDVEGKGPKGPKGPKGELRSMCRAGRRGQVFRKVGDDAEAKGPKEQLTSAPSGSGGGQTAPGQTAQQHNEFVSPNGEWAGGSGSAARGGSGAAEWLKP